MVLLRVVDSNGEKLGECDPSCYLSEEGECRCICGGRNHGVGRAEAILNVSYDFEAILCAMRRDQWWGQVYVFGMEYQKYLALQGKFGRKLYQRLQQIDLFT